MYYYDIPHQQPAWNANHSRKPPSAPREAPHQNQRSTDHSAGGQPRHSGVFSRLGGSAQARQAKDLREVLNDRREKNGEHVPVPATQPEVILPAVQAELQTLKRALEKLAGDKPSYIEHERRKGASFSPRITAAEIRCKFKMSVLPNYIGKQDPVSHVN